MQEAEENLKQPPLNNFLRIREYSFIIHSTKITKQLINISIILISENAEFLKGYKNSYLHVAYSLVYNVSMKLEQNVIWEIITECF